MKKQICFSAVMILLLAWCVPLDLPAHEPHGEEGHAVETRHSEPEESPHSPERSNDGHDPAPRETQDHDHHGSDDQHREHAHDDHGHDGVHHHDHDHEGLAGFLRWLGHWHPSLVHFPIGLLVGAAVAELAFLFTRRSWFRDAVRFCLWAGAAGALLAAPLGWLVGGFNPLDDGWILAVHRWLGTAVVLWAVVQVRLFEKARLEDTERIWKRHRRLLFAGAIAVLVTSHFGGMLVFGPEHFVW